MKLTTRQLDIMSHATTGLTQCRNHFVTGPGTEDYSVCEGLVLLGMMRKATSSWVPDAIYRVTEEGRELLARSFQSATSDTPRTDAALVKIGKGDSVLFERRLCELGNHAKKMERDLEATLDALIALRKFAFSTGAEFRAAALRADVLINEMRLAQENHE